MSVAGVCFRLAAFTLAGGCAPAFTGQTYYDFIPSTPLIREESSGNLEVNLYSRASPHAIDANNDGIDDSRAKRLRAIAARFAPILKAARNSPPRAVEDVLPLHYRSTDQTVCLRVPHLFLDVWSTSGDRAERSGADSISLGMPDGWRELHPGVPFCRSPPKRAAVDDQMALRSLIRANAPTRLRPASIKPGVESDTIVYVDMPVRTESAWRTFLEKGLQARSRVYAHPFVEAAVQATSDAEAPRFRFAVQYWFFYPFNDGGNNHAGDWEHMNVIVAPRSRVCMREPTLFTAAEVDSLVAGSGSFLDDLIIDAVDYYFHHYVQRVSYAAIYRQRCRPLPAAQSPVVGSTAVAARIEAAGGVFARHPIAYAGGINRGPDQLLRLVGHGARNRHSHGTYPFPGDWMDIGPAGATESIRGDVVPPVPNGSPWSHAWRSELREAGWLTYGVDDIVLLPEWRNIWPAALKRAKVRDRWYWLLLPLRFGFPAVESPLAGALRRVNLGNAAPMGPMFTTAWNRTGPSFGFDDYGAERVSAGFATRFIHFAPWDGLEPNAGTVPVNLLLVVSRLLPGLVLGSLVYDAVRGGASAKYVREGRRPRFYDLWAGTAVPLGTWGERAVAVVLPHEESADVAAVLAGEVGATIDGDSYRFNDFMQPVVWALSIHYGQAVSVENFWGWGGGDASYAIRGVDGEQDVVKGRIEWGEFLGGIRVRPNVWSSDYSLEPYVRLGYGWRWYQVEDARLNGVALDGVWRGGGRPWLIPTWFRQPAGRSVFWPNEMSLGFGVEGGNPNPRRLEERVRFRVELNVSVHTFGAEARENEGGTVTRGRLFLMLGLGV